MPASKKPAAKKREAPREPPAPDRKWREEVGDDSWTPHRVGLNALAALILDTRRDTKLQDALLEHPAPMIRSTDGSWYHLSRLVQASHESLPDATLSDLAGMRDLEALVDAKGHVLVRRGDGPPTDMDALRVRAWILREAAPAEKRQYRLDGGPASADDVEVERVESSGVKLKAGMFRMSISDETAEELRGEDPITRRLAVAVAMRARKDGGRVPTGGDWEAALEKLTTKIEAGW